MAPPPARPRPTRADPRTAHVAGGSTRRGAFPSFQLLEALSFTASAVYAGLLLLWLGPQVPTGTLILGWSHGLLWIGLSLLSLLAVRRGTIPFWLAVTVIVIGGVGPFAGTIGFVVEGRRRARASSA